MGFRQGTWATCWEANPKSNTVTSVRLSVSHKNAESGEYEQEFSGYVAFVGASNAPRAARLQRKDRIKLGTVDVTTRYDEKANKTYTNYFCHGFLTESEAVKKFSPPVSSRTNDTDLDDVIDDGTLGEPSGEDDLPF